MGKCIEVIHQEGVVRVRLNRPPLNVLNIEMMRELQTVLEAPPLTAAARVLVLEAEGKAFSAGVDVLDHTPEKVAEMLEVFHALINCLRSVVVPTVALVHGAALGGGAELACACDMVLASEKAKIGQPEICLGVFPPVAMVDLPRTVGPRKAIELILTGAILPAAEALRIGLLNACYPADAFKPYSEQFLGQLTKLSRAALVESKRALRKVSAVTDPAQALRVAESEYLQGIMVTSDAKEGIASFIEKREPRWRHC